MKFSEINLNESLQKAIEDLGFKEPTTVQKKVIPYLLENITDMVALAQTGTGKTAAFGLPIINNTNCNSKFSQTIILCPTRELCLQITKDLMSFSKYIKKINIISIYGGTNINSQIKALKEGAQIIVGTPGRTLDLINRKVLKLNKIEYLVLDEADEMLNMGFKEDIDKILSNTSSKKQTLLFSATMPKEVMKISKTYMSSPKTIEIAKRNEGVKNVDHHYYIVNAKDKYKALRRICDINTDIYGIIFCRTRRETGNIADKLMQDGYNADAIHGELSQAQRDHVMERFRKRKIQILVATDVAARGIDINELTHVINYNLPDDNEVYVHRSGRTGRAGKKGISIIIAHSREGRKLKAIEKMIKRNLQLMQVPNGDEICHIQLMKLIDKVTSTKVNPQIEKYLPSIEEKLAHFKKEELIKHFVSTEFNRFLSFYKNAPDLNAQYKKEQKNNVGKRGERKGYAESGHTRFFINIGKAQEIQTHNLIGLINEYTRKRNIPIGKIDIMRRFSFFEIPSEFENEILKGMKKANWRGNHITVEVSQDPSKKSTKRKKKKDKVNSFENTQRKKKNKSKKRKTNNSKSFKERFKSAK